MNSRIEILKGIHPGKLIERDLKKRCITQRSLAMETNIHYQTINAVIAGKRYLTTEQAVKIEKAMRYEYGFLLLLQTHHTLRTYRDKQLSARFRGRPNIRESLFWDTDFNKINWAKHEKAVIKRVMERGSKDEIKEVKRFYKLVSHE
jgi:addiction module HigA family antidote